MDTTSTRDETGHGTLTEIARLDAPWGKELVVQTVHFDSGLALARLRIREGRRFTLIDLDRATADWLAAALDRALAPDAADHPAAR